MPLDMGKEQYYLFNYNTAVGYSNAFKKQICGQLEKEGLITFDENKKDLIKKYYERKNYNYIIEDTANNDEFISFYEKLEYTKSYKYSIPFFYEGEINLNDLINNKILINFEQYNHVDGYYIADDMKDVQPIVYQADDKIIVKFVLQKFYANETDNNIDYRYIILVYIDTANNVLEIRYDSIKNAGELDYKSKYEANLDYCINWIMEKLNFKLYKCKYADFTDIINNDESGNVKIFRQMMNMGKKGSADLVASEETDFKLPFIGEIRALMDENAVLFDNSPEIKEILEKFLYDKEATASYPYIYLLWINSVSSRNFITKVTFQYFINQYILIQHINDNCPDFRMERMNYAIGYLAKSGAIAKGEELGYK